MATPTPQDPSPSSAPPPPSATRPSATAPEVTSPDPEPFFLSLNPSQPTTILFLHGVTSSHLEWAYIIPLLSSYHLLLVDLPGHSRSSHLPGPYTVQRMADTIAPLIRAHAHNSHAHVVGLSMGAFTSLELARRYPDLCLSVFATGAHPFERGWAWMAARPRLIMGIMWVLHSLPDTLYWALCRWGGMRRHEELREEMSKNRTWEVISGVYGSILGFGWEEVRAVDKVRSLVIAAEKGDDVESARGMARVWAENGVSERLGSKVVFVRGAMHAWDLQMPELFAEGIKAWVDCRELPREYEELVG